jgi:hypothetical protein
MASGLRYPYEQFVLDEAGQPVMKVWYPKGSW